MPYKLEIIPEEIWEKIKRDKIKNVERRYAEHGRVVDFCLQNNLHYVLGIGRRPKPNKPPSVRRINAESDVNKKDSKK